MFRKRFFVKVTCQHNIGCITVGLYDRQGIDMYGERYDKRLELVEVWRSSTWKIDVLDAKWTLQELADQYNKTYREQRAVARFAKFL